MQPKTAVDMHELEQFGSFKASDIEIHESKNFKARPDAPSDYVFGRYFTDHMLEIDWNVNEGW
jgi:hypothetical protein